MRTNTKGILPSTNIVFTPLGKFQAAQSTVLGTVEGLLAWHLGDQTQVKQVALGKDVVSSVVES